MNEVTLRKFPYPFRAALTLCSDIDGTKTAEKFIAIQKFLNTEQNTEFGPGLGLEIGNSFFPATRDDTFSYLSSRPDDRAIIKDFIKAGYIDCLHSYGYGAQSRGDILHILDELVHDGCKLDIWVNHSHAPTNFAAGKMPGAGDIPFSQAYHADITLAYGIKFAHMGRSTCLVGQEVPVTAKALSSIYDPAHPRGSTEKLTRELAKILLAKAGNRQFAIHRDNRLFQPARLRDGRQVYEFNRCNNHWSRQIPDSTGLSYVLQSRFLNALKASEGYMILYTHLGRGNHSPIIPLAGQSALRSLTLSYHQGEIYVATTSRLLNYCLMHRYLEWSYTISPEGCVFITIHELADPIFGPRPVRLEELQGITFYVPDRHRALVSLRGAQISNLVRNPRDHTGQESVMIPRTSLSYPFA